MTATTGDSALSVVAEGRLQILNEAGFLDGSDCVVTARICRQLGEEVAGDAALALAFAVRAVPGRVDRARARLGCGADRGRG